ncbi:metal ABC transporter permease, partial [Bacillus sp. S34]|nr:metal ABC transporter permease [Bacillus sp. S34]
MNAAAAAEVDAAALGWRDPRAGARARERNSIIAVLMPFGLGLGILCLALYKGRAANKFGLLTGQIVSVDNPQLGWLLAISAVVIASLVIMWRPLTFASIDPD